MSDIPEGYRMSEVGVIPEEWEVKTLGECLLKKPEYGINAAAVPYSDNLPVYIRITDISDDGKFLPAGKTSVNNTDSNKFLLEKDDIVFARTGASTGKTYLYSSNDGELVFAGFLIRVKVNPNKLIASYLKSYTETGTYWNWVKIMSMRSGQPGINGNEYAQLQIPLPPIPEQQAIASALSDVDALITALEQLITKKRNIKQGAMQQLLTGEKRLPGFGGAWDVKKLGEIVEIRKGQLITENTRIEGNIPVIAGGKKPSYYHNKPNRLDNTITISGSGANAGYISYFETPIFASDCSTIEEGKGYSIKFIFYQLQLRQDKIYKIQTGGAQPHIHPSDLYPLEMPYLQPDEQQAIAQILSDMDTEIESLEQKRNKYKAIKQGMMQELLTGKRRLV